MSYLELEVTIKINQRLQYLFKKIREEYQTLIFTNVEPIYD